MNNRALCSWVLSLLMVPIICCSTKVYTKEVLEFNKGVVNTSDVFSKYSEILSEKNVEYLSYELPRRQKNKAITVEQSIQCKRAADLLRQELTDIEQGKITEFKIPEIAKECKLLGPDQSGRNIIPIGITRKGNKDVKLIQEIVKYASNLAALVASDDLSELQKSADSLDKNFSSLYGSLQKAGKLGGNTLAPAGPISSLLLKAGTSAVSIKRYLALKEAVNTADPYIEAAAQLLSTELDEILLTSLGMIYGMQEYYSIELQKNNTPGVLQREYVAGMIKRYIVYNQLLKSNPSAVFDGLNKSHKIFKYAVNDPKTQTDAAFSALKSFADKSNEINDSVKKMQQGANDD
jgi:hypothetical protein